MKYLKIQNAGELDVRLVALMGGTTKSKDTFKIGQWGSGLKYSLAWLLKNNLSFKMFIGDEEVQVGTETEIIRDESFEIITIDGKRTSVTTQMGGDAWSAWMIVRELWCNALDEGCEYRSIETECLGESGKTTFYVQLTPDIKKVWDNWNNYFVHGVEPIFSNSLFAIYPGGQSLRFYKNGVLIMEDESVKGLFAYDIKHADINELRQYTSSKEYPIVQSLANANSKVIEYFLENITDEFYEGKMSYDWYTSFSSSWKETLGTSKLIHRDIINQMIGRGIQVDMSSMVVVPENVYKFLTKQFEGVGALRLADKVNEFYEIFDAECELKIKTALGILESCNYFIHPELKFIYGVFGDKRVWAKVSTDSKEIMISECIKNKSTFDIVSTLIEENEHFNTGFGDCSRPFQQHFIDLYTKSLLDKHEILL